MRLEAPEYTLLMRSLRHSLRGEVSEEEGNLKGNFVILARKINGKKGNLMLKKGNFIEDLWKHCLWVLAILSQSTKCSILRKQYLKH
jgi:hypothetical protein